MKAIATPTVFPLKGKILYCIYCTVPAVMKVSSSGDSWTELTRPRCSLNTVLAAVINKMAAGLSSLNTAVSCCNNKMTAGPS